MGVNLGSPDPCFPAPDTSGQETAFLISEGRVCAGG